MQKKKSFHAQPAAEFFAAGVRFMQLKADNTFPIVE